jgi:uncharacterized protein
MKSTIACIAFILSILFAAMGSAPAAQPYLVDRVSIHVADGATLSALVVRPANVHGRLPTALEFTIYFDPAKDLARLQYAVDRGYAGVIAYTRGKGESPQTIVPYEYDGRDANGVIDWVARQAWSDGSVGMMGGSYDGFTQWATAKFGNSHLRTIVPVVPNNPGNGLPMQNNVFLLANYPWIYYVTNNKTLDGAAYNAPKWASLPERWYRSGRAYRDVDAIAGVPNPWLHKWLAHPAYDAYWQQMSPYRREYASIRIPVLTIDGYYGDSTAIGYFNDFQRYNATAQNYLVAGPWDHFGSQGRQKPNVLRGYTLDAAAHIDTWQLTFDWFDYVMRGKPRPALVADRVNYEVMGENRWRHVASLDAMGKTQRFYLTAQKVSKRFYLLSNTPDSTRRFLPQRTDLRDRNTETNDSYPYLIVGKKLDPTDGYAFLSTPFSRATEVSGFDGLFRVRVNKRDLDIGLALYEMLPDGRFVQLAYSTERASFAGDMSRRVLLTPGVDAAIPFHQDGLFSGLVAKGSRLLLTVTVNKNRFAEVNYGTGKDVAAESIEDAGLPMRVEWLTSSYIVLGLQSVLRSGV